MTETSGSLNLMRDIVEPGAAPVWPPEPGVWFVVALVAIWVVAGLALLWLRWRRAAYRREAQRELAELNARLQTPDTRIDALQELCVLVKRVALSAYPRESVAPLSGERWLAFLDDTLGGDEFAQGVGAWLPRIAYSPADSASRITQEETDRLVALLGRWVRGHRGRTPC